ncbi:MAG: AsmA family protein [Acidobacteriota bacterium]
MAARLWSPRRRLIFGTLLLFLVVLVGGALTLPLIVDVNRYRGLIQTEAEKVLGRKVSLGEMSLTLVPTLGVKVAPIEVEDLVRAESLTVGARLMPLLFGGDIQVTKLVVRRPEFRVARSADGRWSFGTAAAERSTSSVAPDTGGEATPFTIRNLQLVGAKVRFHDASLAGKVSAAPGEADVDLEDVALSVDELRLGRPARVHMSAKIAPRGSLSLEGTLPTAFGTQAQSAVDAKLMLESVEVAALAPYLEELVGVRLSAGTVSVQAELSGHYPEELRGRGRLGFEQVKIRGEGQPVTATIDFDATTTQSFKLVRIVRLEVRSGRSHLALSGSVDRRDAATVVDVQVPSTEIEAEDLALFLRLSGSELPFELSASEPLRLEAKVHGDVVGREDLSVEGNLDLTDVTFRHPLMDQPMQQIRAHVSVRNDHLELSDFHGVIGASDLNGSLSVTDLEAPRISFDLTSERANFSELMSFLQKETPAEETPSAAALPVPTEDTLSRICARGKLEIAHGSFGALQFDDLRSTLTLEHKVVRLEPVRMSLYGGSMIGSASVDVNADPPVYSVAAHPQEIGVGPLLSENLGMQKSLVGSLTGDLSITAAGVGMDAILRSARGSGNVRIEEGRVGAINVLAVLSRASGLLGERSLQEVAGRLASEGTDFSQIAAALEVAGGKITSKNLRLVSSDIELTDEGTLDMLAGTIDIAGRIVFSEQISQSMVQEKSRAADYFWDTGLARVSVPLTLAGPLASPRPKIDWQAAAGKLVGRKVQEALRGRLGKTGLGKLLGGKAEPPERQEPPAPKRQEPPPNEQTTPPPKPREPPPNEQATPPPELQEPPATADQAPAGGLDVVIRRTEFSGDSPAPDLKIRGALRGTQITAARLVVSDRKGRVLFAKSLLKQVRTYYQTADPAQPASIRLSAWGPEAAV